MKRPLLVMNIAGLTQGLLDSGHCPRLAAYGKKWITRTIEPVLPALTLPAQATYMTGALPGAHGIVGNGFFDRDYQEHRFWTASAGLLQKPPFWQTGAGTKYRTGALFWWCCLGGGLDYYMNVAPLHTAEGKTISSCYSDPQGLYPDLEKELGPFPLHRFWGPGISIESSAWILAATMKVLESGATDILLTYIPHMDYSLQRSGPGSAEAEKHLAELDALLEAPMDRAAAREFDLVILSEYGITPVDRAVHPNQALFEAGLFSTREVEGRTYPDLVGSRAFAICDHQAAHVYIREESDQGLVMQCLSSLDGVGEILDSHEKSRRGVDHARSGDLFVLSERNAWFSYTWWTEDKAAPPYAFTVDIHRKIGYDPLELILDGARKGIARSPDLIRGSHGLIPEDENDFPVMIIPLSNKEITKPDEALPACQVQEEILKLLAGGHKDL